MLFPDSNTGGWQPVNVVVLHSAVMELFCGAAEDLSLWGDDPSLNLSWHYSIDNCLLFQNVWDNTVAWHDGMNYGHIGIEMCEMPSWDVSRWNTPEHEALLRNTASLVRQLCLFYNVPMVLLDRADVEAGRRGICGHDAIPRWYTTHTDPQAFPWGRFLAMVRNEDEEMTPEQEQLLRDVRRELTGSGQLGEYPGWDSWVGDASPTMLDFIRWIDVHTVQNRRQIQALTKAVEALSVDPTLTAGEVERIVREAVVQHMEITGDIAVTGGSNG